MNATQTAHAILVQVAYNHQPDPNATNACTCGHLYASNEGPNDFAHHLADTLAPLLNHTPEPSGPPTPAGPPALQQVWTPGWLRKDGSVFNIAIGDLGWTDKTTAITALERERRAQPTAPIVLLTRHTQDWHLDTSTD